MIRWLWWISEQASTLVRDPAYNVMSVRTPTPIHEHYCPEHDRRWACEVNPCLLYYVGRCPNDNHGGGGV